MMLVLHGVCVCAAVREECGPHEHSCDNGMCVSVDYVCDGQDDCHDGSDETSCGESPSTDSLFININAACS